MGFFVLSGTLHGAREARGTLVFLRPPADDCESSSLTECAILVEPLETRPRLPRVSLL